MARGRMLNRTIADDLELVALGNDAGPWCLLYFDRLITWIDKNGNVNIGAEWAKGHLFPHNKQVTAEDCRIFSVKLTEYLDVTTYTDKTGIGEFMHIHNFFKNQVGFRPEKEKAEWPDCSDEIKSKDDYGDILEGRKKSVKNTEKKRKKSVKRSEQVEVEVEVEGEIEKKEVENIHTRVFAFWNSHPVLISHRKLDSRIKSAINGRVGDGSSEQEICDTIRLYAEVLESPAHYFKHKWPLHLFLSRSNGFPCFTPEANPLQNFLSTKIESAYPSKAELRQQHNLAVVERISRQVDENAE